MKKQGDKLVVETSTNRKPLTSKSASSRKKRVDVGADDGKVQKLRLEYEKVKREHEELSARVVELKREYDTILSSVKTLKMLLASFNAIVLADDVRLTTPSIGTTYWYIRSMSSIKRFDVVDAVWKDSTSDHYRYAKGNVYLDLHVVEKACQALNIMLLKLSQKKILL